MFTVLATALAIVATWWQLGLPQVVFSSEIMAIHARIDTLEAFNPRLLVLDQTLLERQPARHALAGVRRDDDRLRRSPGQRGL
jgi:hypothetical protein